MNKAIGAALVVVGIILLVMGVNASDSIASGFSKFFTGAPTDRAIWMMIGGAAALVGGIVVVFMGKRGLAS